MCATRADTQEIMDLHRAAAIDIMTRREWLVADQFEHQVRRRGDNTALIFENQRLSWNELNERAEDFACRLLASGLKPGESCAIMVENRPEFLFAWLGANKIAVTAGLLNTSARGPALLHAMKSTNARVLLLGDECAGQLKDSGLESDHDLQILRIADGINSTPSGRNAIDIHSLDISHLGKPDFKTLRQDADNLSACSYVFTSGTTGLPKAANISHGRYLAAGAGWQASLGLSENDVYYCSLPLFHSSALMSLYSTALLTGGPIYLRRKFSVSNFWKDVRAHKVTVFQYVGEVCRYLTNAPPVPEENHHSLRFLIGSGMGIDVWRRFTERFGEHVRIIEGWGSTESNCTLANFDQKPGSCGRIPFPENSHMRLLRYDQEADELERDSTGGFIVCKPGEVGEMHGQIQRGNGEMVSPFEGYTSQEATEAKILRNVFETGDAWWRSGDLFRHDEDGYFYFVDRIGDTFRWKGENVSTLEVAQLLSDYIDADTINIYGVKVPEHEGRACMAAITLREGHEFDPEKFYRCAEELLPEHARPLFVRILSEADITANFKLRKVRLRDEGFDRRKIKDALYGLDRAAGSYRPLSDELLTRMGVPASSPTG